MSNRPSDKRNEQGGEETLRLLRKAVKKKEEADEWRAGRKAKQHDGGSSTPGALRSCLLEDEDAQTPSPRRGS